MKSVPVLIHALTPLHAGTGQAAELIDLPIARMRGTEIPFVPGSSLKGALRQARGGNAHGNGDADPKALAIFGPDKDHAGEHAGALVVGDARLLAMPVRSFWGTFALVTSPLLLHLAARDWPALATVVPQMPQPGLQGAQAATAETCVINRTIILEELDLTDVQVGGVAKALGDLLERALGTPWLSQRVVIVHDEVMSHLMLTATQVDARNSLDPETRTVKRGALWLEESLAPESILISCFTAEPSRRKDTQLSADEILDRVLPAEGEVLQFGGKATVGRGRCRILSVADVTAPTVDPARPVSGQAGTAGPGPGSNVPVAGRGGGSPAGGVNSSTRAPHQPTHRPGGQNRGGNASRGNRR